MKKKWKKHIKKTPKMFFFLIVSDHVVTLNCFTVRAHFFDFPIDFFWGLPPSLYADEVLCAAFRAARTPPYSIRVRQNSQNDETQCKSVKRFFYATGAHYPPHILFGWRKIIDISLQKSEKNMSTTNAKIELSFEPELNFCNFWGLQNEPPKALWTPTWLHHFS